MKMLSGLGIIVTAAAFMTFSPIAQAKLENLQSLQQTPLEVTGAKLSLVFSGTVDVASSSVDIRDERGRRVEIGRLKLDDNGSNLDIPLGSALKPGIYTISWHATSTNGLVSVGSYSFVITSFGDQAPAYASQ